MTDKIFLVKAKNIVDYIKLLNLDVNTNDIVFKELTSKELELIKIGIGALQGLLEGLNGFMGFHYNKKPLEALLNKLEMIL